MTGNFFILIDDDPINNLITKTILSRRVKNSEIKDFTDPELALEFIEKNAEQIEAATPIIVLLDINMPTMTGWEVLDAFDKLQTPVKNKIKILIHSSSVFDKDIERAGENIYVAEFIQKPLTLDKVNNLILPHLNLISA